MSGQGFILRGKGGHRSSVSQHCVKNNTGDESFDGQDCCGTREFKIDESEEITTVSGASLSVQRELPFYPDME